MVRYEDFKNALADGKQKCLERLKIDLERRSLDDLHNSMSWWACFNGEQHAHPPSDGFDNIKLPTNLNQTTLKFKKKKNKARKKKRKQAKASKREKTTLTTNCPEIDSIPPNDTADWVGPR
jgi:hypothetical protein